ADSIAPAPRRSGGVRYAGGLQSALHSGEPYGPGARAGHRVTNKHYPTFKRVLLHTLPPGYSLPYGPPRTKVERVGDNGGHPQTPGRGGPLQPLDRDNGETPIPSAREDPAPPLGESSMGDTPNPR